jgi:hypothetical protein
MPTQTDVDKVKAALAEAGFPDAKVYLYWDEHEERHSVTLSHLVPGLPVDADFVWRPWWKACTVAGLATNCWGCCSVSYEGCAVDCDAVGLGLEDCGHEHEMWEDVPLGDPRWETA